MERRIIPQKTRHSVRSCIYALGLIIASFIPISCDNNAMETEDTSTTETITETFQRVVNAINNQDLDALDDLVRPTFVRHCQATAPLEVNSLDAFKEFLRQDRATFPDEHISVNMAFADGNMLAAHLTLTGTQEGPIGPFPATGKKATVEFLGILRFEGGKVAEMWVEWDNLNMLSQLGLFPPPSE